MAAAGVLLIVLVVALFLWWLHARQFELTDDAFIDAHVVTVSAQVSGSIVGVPVTDNQLVNPGTVLVQLDQRDFAVALAQANAEADQRQANIANIGAQLDEQQAKINQAQTQVSQAKAALTFAQEENARAQDLQRRGAGTEQRAQQTSSELRQRQAEMSAAQANLVAEQKQVAVLKAQQDVASAELEQAEAAVEQAQVNLSRTAVNASIEGYVANLSAAKGTYAQVGQALMMLVPRDVWVKANFKETQLAQMRPGQPVSIEIDAYPGRTFQGHVDSIQAGSGAAFSLLPPENATGNYVKIVQRVPVKIVFDVDPNVYLGPGMSVVPTVKVQ